MYIGAVGINQDGAADLFSRMRSFIEKKSASLVTRPGRVGAVLPEKLEDYQEKPYQVGDIHRSIEKTAMEVLVRTGAQTEGLKLPKAPAGPDRFRIAGSLQQALDALKAMERQQAPGVPTEKKASGSLTGKKDRLLDYAGKAWMGVGLGRGTAFLRGIEAPLAQRRLGRIGLVLGLAAAGLSHADASKRERASRERAMQSALNTVLRQVSQKDMMQGINRAVRAPSLPGQRP